VVAPHPQANNASSGTKRSRARPNSFDTLQFKNKGAAINAKAHSQGTDLNLCRYNHPERAVVVTLTVKLVAAVPLNAIIVGTEQLAAVGAPLELSVAVPLNQRSRRCLLITWSHLAGWSPCQRDLRHRYRDSARQEASSNLAPDRTRLPKIVV
jgi:hypothetical protein